MDHDTFEPLGRWEVDRGPQQFAYDFWCIGIRHHGHQEWGLPNMVEEGLNPEILLSSGSGHICTWGPA